MQRESQRSFNSQSASNNRMSTRTLMTPSEMMQSPEKAMPMFPPMPAPLGNKGFPGFPNGGSPNSFSSFSSHSSWSSSSSKGNDMPMMPMMPMMTKGNDLPMMPMQPLPMQPMPMQPMPMQPMPMPSRPAPMLPLPPPQGNMKGNIPAWTGPIPEDATVTQTPGSQFPTYTWKATQPGGYTTTHWYSGPLGPDRVPPNFDSPSIPHLPSIPVTFKFRIFDSQMNKIEMFLSTGPCSCPDPRLDRTDP